MSTNESAFIIQHQQGYTIEYKYETRKRSRLKKDQSFLCKEARIPCQWAERESSTFHEYLSYNT